MKRDRRSIEDLLRQSRPPEAPQMATALGRVLNRLRADHGETDAPMVEWDGARRSRRSVVWTAAAAAALVIVAVGGAIVWPRGVRVYAAGADGLEVTLADDSRVEMRAHAEMAVDRASDGIRIDLKTGDIIVTAAKPRDGQLFVRTKYMTVALSAVAHPAKADGTIALVNAAEDGSRVGVIEGEVRVREGNVETRLRPGEQVATSPTIAQRALAEDITWSRNKDAHLRILESFTRAIAQTSGSLSPVAPSERQRGTGAAVPAAMEFEEVSIRECDPDNLPPSPVGARGGGANSLLMTPGHFYVACMTLATVIRTAYEYGPVDLEFMFGTEIGRRANNDGMRFEAVYGLGVEDGRRVRGGPGWIHDVRYSIEAISDSRATAAMMRAPMLRDLLERRFQLKVHVETEQISAYQLVVGPGGLKPLKPFQESDCEGLTSDSVRAERARKGWTGPVLITEAAYFGIKPSCGGVYGETNGPNVHVEFANSTPGAIAGTIGGSMGVRVIDRTNIAERFTYTWDFGIDDQTPRALEDLRRGKTWNPKPGWDSPMTIPKAPSIFAAVEQLGLKLEPIRVPREFIVIDSVERPSPN